MRKKLISVGAVVLVLALLLTVAPGCGGTSTPTKTLKIGFLGPLSGPAAPVGVTYMLGAEWAANRINEAGGFKVGDDRYNIEIVGCDDQYTPSVAVTCATRLIYDDQVSYVIGPIAIHVGLPVLPMFAENKVISSDIIAFLADRSQYPYSILGMPVDWDGNWSGTMYDAVLELHPDIKTVGQTFPSFMKNDFAAVEIQEAEKRGLTVYQELYEMGTTDFYPILTKIIAKNPDAIDFGASSPGEWALMIKQARELGYTGILFVPNGMAIDLLVSTAGKEAVEGLLCLTQDWESPLWPKATREVAQDFLQRYPDSALFTTTISAYASVNLFVQAMQEVDTTDPDTVLTVFDDPDFTFNLFGFADAKFGGQELQGILRTLPHPQAFSIIKNGEVEQLDVLWIESP
ncbi:ABC transporter substrate-binding protein [Chloroflexota bacterium]